MQNQKHIEPSDEKIRARSYLIWEREGRQNGRDEEYWLRAKAEIETEFEAHCHCASLEGGSTHFVLPLLPISKSPLRTIADRMPDRAKPGTPTGEVSDAHNP